VNTPIVRLYALILVLFAGLVYFSSKWAVFDADALKGNPLNHRPLIETQTIKRGNITTADGQLIAESKPQGGGANPIYVRDYPLAALFGHPIGYSFIQVGQSELESSLNDTLVGDTNEFSSILDELRGHAQSGDNVTLTINSNVQKTAMDALDSANASTSGSNGAGAVVALNPTTGAVLAMASTPGFDPNAVANTDTYAKLNRDKAAPLVDRAVQSRYPPGSTMKVVTATAGLDSGDFTPTTTLNAPATLDVSGTPLANDDQRDYGAINMTTALTNSVNTFFAQVGEKVGIPTMVEYMKRYGFYSDPKLDLPDTDMTASGPLNTSGNLVTDGFDVGRVAIGQGGAEGTQLSTPFQMAEVAATVANGGVLEKPQLVQKVTDPDGRTVSELHPEAQSTVMKPETASELTKMMVNVTADVSGTAAGLTVGGEPFAGKTGTAEIGDPADGIHQPWFIAFAPANDPQVAVAATIERCSGCFGAEVAGPIATKVMEAALAAGG
jgi:peptidoglycan glycosyltransferase